MIRFTIKYFNLITFLSCFIFCLLGSCNLFENVENDCRPVNHQFNRKSSPYYKPSSFNCEFIVTIKDFEKGINCGPYTVEVEMYSCKSGETSFVGSQSFNGCWYILPYEFVINDTIPSVSDSITYDSFTYLYHSDSSILSTKMESIEDFVDFKLLDKTGELLGNHRIGAGEITRSTWWGIDWKGFEIKFIVPQNTSFHTKWGIKN